ncbi:hypothetical protein [Croceicoccus gelatinilyticus]|uniref:hypothetical protein n=1 Tax=Croceicoccus gelatinilyticus TaxID=2835536 RepID=UPI001BCC85F2|nr:hypothetical protein [Croceicoccus gelatinilyticus]MBS7671355.1 hypothetical protein [Croceicoccus gelatinilyticus]
MQIFLDQTYLPLEIEQGWTVVRSRDEALEQLRVNGRALTAISLGDGFASDQAILDIITGQTAVEMRSLREIRFHCADMATCDELVEMCERQRDGEHIALETRIASFSSSLLIYPAEKFAA